MEWKQKHLKIKFFLFHFSSSSSSTPGSNALFDRGECAIDSNILQQTFSIYLKSKLLPKGENERAVNS